MSPYLRTVKTSSGATAVQIVHSSHRGSRDIEHLGSARTAAEVELLKAAARQKLAAGQGELDLGLQTGAPGGPQAIISSVMGCLVDALAHAYEVLGFPAATDGDQVFFQLVAARIIEPVTSRSAAKSATFSATIARACARAVAATCASSAALRPASPTWTAALVRYRWPRTCENSIERELVLRLLTLRGPHGQGTSLVIELPLEPAGS